MAATVKKNIELVKLLLQKKANPNAVDQNGSSALHFSVIFSYEEIIKLLISSKADPSIKDNRGNSALDYAGITNNKKITELLKQQ
jgi:ankyrin repeat protein